MRFGLGPLDTRATGPLGLVDAYEELLEHAAAAEWWGFDSVFASEDPFGAPGANPSSPVLAAALAQRTSHVRVGLMPTLGLSNALYVAEEAACVDNLANGRALVAAQAPSERTLRGWGIDGSQVRQRLADDLRVLRLAWAPAPFAYHGGRYRVPAQNPVHREAQGIVQISVQPKPAQLDLPLWLHGGAEAAALARELGLTHLGAASLALDEVGELLAPQQGLARVVPLCRDIVIARRGDDARARARELGVAAELAGGPDEVGEALSRYAELGVNYVVARVVHPGMTHPEALDAIQLFGQAVVPGFRMYGLPPEISALP